ncbi:MAG: carbonic anhydrase [Alphaproteobacteria bacterium]|nr:MAG: carbonic anhydrase [Alphaproteobacteria bacterium]
MNGVRPLPGFLVKRYQGWRATDFAENAPWYRRLAEEGQRPRAMVISCCDSRVDPNNIFTSEPGEFFVHRNIANLVPPCEPGAEHHGTSAAIEYAVRSLKVAHLIVLGHSGCGGVRGCHDMCTGRAPELENESFVGRWLDILRPGYERVSDRQGLGDEASTLRALEWEAVRVSLENLVGFPFIREAVENGALTLHGLWADIATGELWGYDPAGETFEPL